MYKISLTPLSNADLREITNYIGINLQNRKAVFDFLSEVDKLYANLESMPKMYAVCDDFDLYVYEFRKAKIKNYIVIFTIDEEAKTVTVLRFLYGARDYQHLL